jgi:hypothetical protein
MNNLCKNKHYCDFLTVFFIVTVIISIAKLVMK